VIGRVSTRAGVEMPVLGQGTWKMGEDPARRRTEVAALRLGIELGMTLIDTAEMYADGGAEEVVGEAIHDVRDEIFLVSKVLPQHASREGVVRAAEHSLRRLRTDRIDLYLLHWPGSEPLEETLAGFERLAAQGKIGAYGVSNFDGAEMAAAEDLPGGSGIAANQVLYNLTRRGVERRLLPWCAERRIAVLAYSPVEQGRLPAKNALARVARRHGATTFAVAIAWTIRNENIVAIPKASRLEHVRENAGASDLCLTEEDLADLDRAFPVPGRDVPLEML
jgi:diketogulonate reductase-like aldo/keto reductase